MLSPQKILVMPLDSLIEFCKLLHIKHKKVFYFFIFLFFNVIHKNNFMDSRGKLSLIGLGCQEMLRESVCAFIMTHFVKRYS